MKTRSSEYLNREKQSKQPVNRIFQYGCPSITRRVATVLCTTGRHKLSNMGALPCNDVRTIWVSYKPRLFRVGVIDTIVAMLMITSQSRSVTISSWYHHSVRKRCSLQCWRLCKNQGTPGRVFCIFICRCRILRWLSSRWLYEAETKPGPGTSFFCTRKTQLKPLHLK